MIDKQPGLIPCAHCSNQQGVGTCRWCGHMICEDCQNNPERCPAPHTFALPRGGRPGSASATPGYS